MVFVCKNFLFKFDKFRGQMDHLNILYLIPEVKGCQADELVHHTWNLCQPVVPTIKHPEIKS